ncbi:MAG TPA: TonB-dependent receptor [Thermoanaerobaculia bacterium]|nr:TonB-dependent receptor [Thermoanaerobaculia bacterium]
MRLSPWKTAGLTLWLLTTLMPAGWGQEPGAEDLKDLSLEELMEIDVTSVSRRSERFSGVPAALTVLTADEIRRSGANSLPEVLRLATGLHVARADGRTWAISARGFNITTANKLLVLIDGRTVYTPLFSGVFWDVQDTLLDDIERIEIIRGPGATLWGANAVNGVINIITRSAGTTQGGLAIAGGGTEERAFGGVRYGAPLGERGHYRAYAKYSDRDALQRASGADARDPMWLGQGGFRSDWRGSDADTFTLQGDAYTGRSGEAIRDDSDVDGSNLLGRWSRAFSDTSNMELQVYWDRTHRHIPGLFEEHLDTWDLDFQHSLRLAGRHDVVWGFGYRLMRDRVGNGSVVAFLPPRRTMELGSVFAQDEIELVADRLRLTVGSKLEYNDSTGLEVQPNVRLSWTPDERRTLWGAVSRAVRTPTRIDEDFVVYSVEGDIFTQGSRDFDSEKLLAYELGFRSQLRPDLSLDVATFYNVYDDLRSQEQAPGGGPPITLANNLEGETYGVELRSYWQATPRWRWHASYVYLEKDLRVLPGSTDVTGGKGEGNDPRHRASLRSSLDLADGVELDGWLRYVDELPFPEVPSYLELDLRLGWRPTEDLELALVGQNLLHESHPEFGVPTPIRPEVERGVYGKATWRF